MEPPTLISLGIEWPIQGDDNRNASVTVEYRRKGEATWKRGLDLPRLQGEETFLRGALDYTAPNMFSGSLFDLQEDSDYEIRLSLTDPDALAQAMPRMSKGRSRRARAQSQSQPKAATSTMCTHPALPARSSSRHLPDCWRPTTSRRWVATGAVLLRRGCAQGDTILVHAGVYLSKHDQYSHEINSRFTTCCSTPWDGTYYLTQDGTADKPIAIIAAGDGEVIFDGDGNTVLFNLMAGDYHYFEGITFRNTGTVIEAGQKLIAGSKGLTVKRSRFVDVGTAVHSDWSGSAGFYIADNDLLGRESLTSLFTWYAIKPWTDFPDFAERAKMKSFYAISVYGQGHVFAYNRIRGFHDGIDHATYGMPDNWPDTPRERMPVSIDIYNNDISVMHDNCIEADGAMHNIRVMRNRCFNAALGAMSPQPIFGGPAYFIRNVVYNANWGPVKIHADPAGVLLLQQHLHRRVPHAHAGIQPASAQQSDIRTGNQSARAVGGHVHQLQQLRLQRLSRQSRRGRVLCVELATIRCGARLLPGAQGCRHGRGSRLADGQRPQPGGRARPATDPGPGCAAGATPFRHACRVFARQPARSSTACCSTTMPSLTRACRIIPIRLMSCSQTA